MIIDKKILKEVTHDLWAHRNELTTDQVDGTYYWRACLRNEIIAALPGEEWLEDNPLLARYPEMRGAVRLNNDFQLEEFKRLGITVGIRNAAWRGKHVEAAIRQLAQRRTLEQLAFGVEPQSPDAQLMLKAQLYRPGEYQHGVRWSDASAYHVPGGRTGLQAYAVALFGDSPAPGSFTWSAMVGVSVAYPLPAPGVIAAWYDAEAIDRLGWHQELSADDGQSVEVAIRTWAIGLLMATGLDFRQASGVLHSQWKIGTEATQQMFQRDRARLLRRVPEASPYLRQRGL